MELTKEWNNCGTTTATIIACAFRVSNALGRGFLEKAYENALAIELRDAGLTVLQQPRVEVLYKGRVVGEYVADLIVENSVVVEVKALESLAPTHESQAINYLRATNLHIALLLNFGRSRIQYRRLVWQLPA